MRRLECAGSAEAPDVVEHRRALGDAAVDPREGAAAHVARGHGAAQRGAGAHHTGDAAGV